MNIRKVPSAIARMSALAFMIVGLILVVFGAAVGTSAWQEREVSENTTREPVDVDLATLESGERVTNNHVKIGSHYALYYSAVLTYETYDRGSDKPSGDQFLRETYYPIISKSNPDIQKLEKLRAQFGGRDKAPSDAQLSTLQHFTVLVKSNRFKQVRDIPSEPLRIEDSVHGLVINEVSRLGIQEEELIKKKFPNIDIKKVLILEEGRTPSSDSFSMAFVIGGICVLLLGLASATTGVVKTIRGRSSRKLEPIVRQARYDPATEPTCPRCGRETEVIQTTDAPFVLCLFFFITWRRLRIVGCPKCVQRRLWLHFWVSIPLSNIVLPIVWTFIIAEIRASRRGASRAVALGFADDQQISEANGARSDRTSGVRVLGIAIACVIVIGLFFMCLMPFLTR